MSGRRLFRRWWGVGATMLSAAFVAGGVYLITMPDERACLREHLEVRSWHQQTGRVAGRTASVPLWYCVKHEDPA